MEFINSIFASLITLLIQVLSIYRIVLFISIILSWIRPDPYNPIVKIIYKITQPVFSKVRQWLPFLRAGMMDFSPIVVIIGIQILANLLGSLLIYFK